MEESGVFESAFSECVFRKKATSSFVIFPSRSAYRISSPIWASSVTELFFQAGYTTAIIPRIVLTAFVISPSSNLRMGMPARRSIWFAKSSRTMMMLTHVWGLIPVIWI